jgi:cytochrome c-type biogenesis protein CcmE
MTTTDLVKRRAFTVAAIAVVAVTLVVLAYGNIGENLVYYWGPAELMEAGDDAIGASIRLGGLVVPGSIERSADSLDLRFQVTDGTETVQVHASTVPPAMFRGGIGVVIEGTARNDGVFESRRLMVKHDNEYQAPDSEDNRDMQELMRSLQFEAEATGG